MGAARPLAFVEARRLGLVAASAPYVLAAGALFVLTTLPDRGGDAAAGDRTLGVALGERPSVALALLLTAACALTGWNSGDHGVAAVAVALPMARPA